MTESLLLRHKPDILDCIANLSNDEVFTPPALANKMLDLLPAEVWTNPELRFLDPGCKSGVFLREAAKRLMKGLEAAIPDETIRREHIFKNMLHGIAITELTAQISRRTLYYSKDASSEQSVVQLPTSEGNIRYQNIAHTFKAGSCIHCGAPEATARDLAAHESHTYLFIHEKLDPTMKFDVIIGNPPYQLKDGGGTGASPIYQHFVERAFSFNPSYVSMVIPSRWFAGGKGLEEFRSKMLSTKEAAYGKGLRVLVDHPDAHDCFPGVEIKGGVCYFLWQKSNGSNVSTCQVRNIVGGVVDEAARIIDKHDVFLRFNKAVAIVDKVLSIDIAFMSSKVSSPRPFGLRTNFRDFSKIPAVGLTPLYARGEKVWVNPNLVTSNKAWLPKWKVLVSYAYGGGEGFPHQVLGAPIIAEPSSCCTETYLVIDIFDSELEAQNCANYLKTKFFRFMALQRKATLLSPKSAYGFVPKLDMHEVWDDAKLYQRYGLTAEEVAYIESMIKEMP